MCKVNWHKSNKESLKSTPAHDSKEGTKNFNDSDFREEIFQ